MISHYNSSDRLKNLRMNSVCYRLLEKAVITVENLPNLYRTYRVPADPFFPLFLKIKLDYFASRKRIQEERELFIMEKVKKLSPVRRRAIRFLAEWEEELTGGKSRRCWEKVIYPGSKKRACELQKFSDMQWIELYSEDLKVLEERYALSPLTTSRVSAALTLQLIPGLGPLKLPDSEDVRRAYRRLSRIYHPDSGGESPLFVAIGECREILMHS